MDTTDLFDIAEKQLLKLFCLSCLQKFVQSSFQCLSLQIFQTYSIILNCTGIQFQTFSSVKGSQFPWRFFPDSSHVLQKFFLSVTYGHIFSLKSFHRFPYAQKMPDLFHWKTLHKWFLLLSFFPIRRRKNWQNPDTYHSQEVNHIPQIPGKSCKRSLS